MNSSNLAMRMLLRPLTKPGREMNARLLIWLAAALITNGASLATAHAQAVTTLDPNFFNPGTNVSTAFAGVTLQAMTLVSDGTNSQGAPLVTPSYAPVYADGNFFSTQSSPSTAPANWGILFLDPTTSCLQTCIPPTLNSSGGAIGTDLLISFNKPVDIVTALQIDNPFNGMLMQAFNSADQLVADCLPAAGPQPQGNYGCYSVLNSNGNPCGDSENCELSTSTSASDISKVTLGGYSGFDEIGAVKYDAVRAPEIDPASAASGLALLVGGVAVLRGRRRLNTGAGAG